MPLTHTQGSGLGLDFGTSNSLAARVDGEGLRPLPLEGTEVIMPTATYLDRDFKSTIGQAAIDAYIEDNRGRTVELIPEVIGKSSLLTQEGGAQSRAAPETLTQDVYGPAVEDAGLPGRLFRGLKRLLGDPETRRLMVFGQPYRLVALIVPVLLGIRRAMEAEGAMAHTPLCVGHPVHFEGRHAHRDRTGLARLEEACRYAGLPPLTFYPEPLAATLAWLHRAEAGGQGTALTVDFGGGTLDLCVVRFADQAMDILSTAGAALGGDHLDQKLFETLLFPALGEGERWRRAGDEREIDTPFPFNRYAPFLLNWSIAYTLNQNQFRAPVMDLMARSEPSARKFRRLYTLITQNLAYETFAALREGKRQLSETASVSIDLPELDLSLTLDRPRFEQLIAPELERFDAAVQEALDRAGLPPEAIDVVITTGGSSLIPAVQARLQDRFGDRLVSHDPFASVASGLALAAAQGLGAAPPR